MALIWFVDVELQIVKSLLFGGQLAMIGNVQKEKANAPYKN